MGKSDILDGDKYIELGFILNRSRSEENNKKVVEVLALNIPIEEKKRKIEEIDRFSREQRIKTRFRQLLESNLDPKIRVHLDSSQKGSEENTEDIKKNYSVTSILLIDDLPYITKTVSYMLRKENYQVFTSKNGTEGIILFQRLIPDLVITDIRLPDFNGIELAELIRKLDETVPIIFITAVDTDVELKHQDLLKRRMALLQKPVLKEVLMDTIRRLLD